MRPKVTVVMLQAKCIIVNNYLFSKTGDILAYRAVYIDDIIIEEENKGYDQGTR
jgi:hypothetical protein